MPDFYVRNCYDVRIFIQNSGIFDRKINWIQAPGFIRGEKQRFLSLSQAPGFRHGVNPKSKIQNPKLNELGKAKFLI